MLKTWCQERDQNISKIFVFNFHHSIQHDEASNYTLYNEIYCSNFKFRKAFLQSNSSSQTKCLGTGRVPFQSHGNRLNYFPLKTF